MKILLERVVPAGNYEVMTENFKLAEQERHLTSVLKRWKENIGKPHWNIVSVLMDDTTDEFTTATVVRWHKMQYVVVPDEKVLEFMAQNGDYCFRFQNGGLEMFDLSDYY